MASPLDTADLRHRVQDCLDAELTTQAAVLAELGPDVDELVTAISALLRGGKRLRAAFLYWGHRAAGRPDSDALIRASKKYPKCKDKIKQIRQQQAWNKFLSQ